jgi:hypothetical protein
MSSPAPVALARPDDRTVVRRDADVDHSFLPDFAWAAVGGAAVLAVCVLFVMLTAPLGGGAAISANARELAAAFMAGFLVVLIARTLSSRSR